MKKVYLIISTIIFLSCANSNTEKVDTENQEVEVKDTIVSPAEVISETTIELPNTEKKDNLSREEFLSKLQHEIPNCYGWTNESNNLDFIIGTEVFYTFYNKGALEIQGNDGEATMWEGTWDLMGDKMTLKYEWRSEQGEFITTDTTVTVYMQGEKLIMADKIYKKYCL